VWGLAARLATLALFLDSSFDKGHSWPCVTFHSAIVEFAPLTSTLMSSMRGALA